MRDDLDGPSITCEPFGALATNADGRRLTAEQRQRLARIASPVSFKRGQLLYRQGESATALYNIIHGVVSV
jgi:CRP-like cAMP-binding protein